MTVPLFDIEKFLEQRELAFMLNIKACEQFNEWYIKQIEKRKILKVKNKGRLG